MKVQVNDAANSQKELIFEVPFENYAKVAENELNKIMPTVKVHGFRQGKAPKEIVRKQYSHKIKANALERVLNNSIQEAFTSNSIRPLSQANVKDVVFEEDKPITFTALVDVFPVIKLDKYKDFDFERKVVSISDSDVDNALDAIKDRQMTYEPVTNRQEVINGDIAVIDFVGKKDGVAFAGGSAEKFSLNIGSGQFIPGFEDGVIGMKIGEVKDLNLTFPKEYGQPDLAGKDVVFTVTLHEIKEKVAPKIDDEFAKDVNPNCETLKDLKELITKGLQSDVDSRAKFEVFGVMLNKIVSENPFEVPFSFVKEQAERMAYNSMTQFYQMGLNPEQVGINFETMVGQHIPQATEQVKQALVINEIAKIENIVVNDEDTDKFLSYHADLQGRSLDDLKKELSDKQQLESIKNDVLGDKVYEYLVSVNKVKDIKMTKAEFDNVGQAEVKDNKEDKEEKPKKRATKPRTTKAKKTEESSEG